MTRSLPAVPSLVQLKHQAKDLRTQARHRDPDALAMLRRLHRFGNATDHEIASAPLRLSEVQFALALSYGARSWADLKTRVEQLRAQQLRERSAPLPLPTTITGFEATRWGAGSRQCSTIATMSLVSERAEDRTDYDYLMGASGAAFRVQMSEGRLCPSSPHALCGFNCAELAVAAWGSEATWFDTTEGREDERVAALQAVRQSLQLGIPALHEHEESSLIVGMTEQGAVLLRAYGARAVGYEPMSKWPFKVGVASPKVDTVDPRAVLRDSLRIAVQLFDTDKVGNYTCGRHAYEHWRALLRDEAMHAAASDRLRFGSRIGNAHTFACLIDARGAAANYLQAMAPLHDGPVQEMLLTVSDIYADIERSCAEQRRELAPFPWELPAGSAWTAVQRHRLADHLSEIGERDAQAVQSLRGALLQLDKSPIAARDA
jgi:hypothetical protein